MAGRPPTKRIVDSIWCMALSNSTEPRSLRPVRGRFSAARAWPAWAGGSVHSLRYCSMKFWAVARGWDAAAGAGASMIRGSGEMS